MIQGLFFYTILILLLLGCDSHKSPPFTPQLSVPAASQGNAQDALEFIAACNSCHGTKGDKSLDAAPFLSGQQEQYLISALNAYVSGKRQHPIMQNILQSFSEKNRLDFAAYYANDNAKWDPKAIRRTNQVDPQKLVKRLAKQGKIVPCASCHGKDGNSTNPGVPSLSLLEPEYMEIALNGYISGQRIDPYMTNFKLALSKVDIKSLSEYFSHFKPLKTRIRSKSGNAKRGKRASKQCIGCHGVNGNSPVPSIPSLAGQNSKYLITAMQAYNKGTRKNQLMQKALKALSNKTINDIAKYYSLQTPTKGSETTKQQKLFRPLSQGAKIAEVCNGCHGENGNSTEPGVPSLSRLHPEYLTKAIVAYKNGQRSHKLMSTLVGYLSEVEIAKVAYYYAAQIPEKTKIVGKGDVTAARKMVAQCNSCHGTNGNSLKPSVPTLAGQDVVYLISAINAYASGKRKHSDMQNAVKELSAADIKNITTYYAKQPPLALETRTLLSPKMLSLKCDRCHGKNGFSNDPAIPRIAGQVPAYFEQALLAYKNKIREHSTMNIMSSVLTRIEINALALYYFEKGQ